MCIYLYIRTHDYIYIYTVYIVDFRTLVGQDETIWNLWTCFGDWPVSAYFMGSWPAIVFRRSKEYSILSVPIKINWLIDWCLMFPYMGSTIKIHSENYCEKVVSKAIRLQMLKDFLVVEGLYMNFSMFVIRFLFVNCATTRPCTVFLFGFTASQLDIQVLHFNALKRLCPMGQSHQIIFQSLSLGRNMLKDQWPSWCPWLRKTWICPNLM